jgi:hypothetical protein
VKATYAGGLPSGPFGVTVDATVERKAVTITLPDGGHELLPLAELVGVHVAQQPDRNWLISIDYERRGFRSTLRLAVESESDAVMFEQQLQRAKLAPVRLSPAATVRRIAALNVLKNQAARKVILGVFALGTLLFISAGLVFAMQYIALTFGLRGMVVACGVGIAVLLASRLQFRHR